MEQQVNYYKAKLNYEMDSSDLFTALNINEKIIVIDARQAVGFKKEHIPGAINLPHRSINGETTKDFDKTTLYVTYCDGIGCNASTKGALKLANLGFKVKELIGGIEWWKIDGYTTEGTHPFKSELHVQCAC